MPSSHIPHLVDTEVSKQLIVNGKPFLILGAELQNSSLSSAEYMETVWEDLVHANVNTILGSVTWETIEPVEGKFQFEELDKVIFAARKHDLRLVLLWFGSFKNGASAYVPGWVKTDPVRFPRAKLMKENGVLETSNVLSLFHEEAVKADSEAFATLMGHIKEIDEAYSTVIMVQVENEPGLLGSSRDGSPAASQKFSEPVPEDLLGFLSNSWDSLHPDLKSYVTERPDVGKNANWEAVFGEGAKTDELFMAYHFSRFVNQVASAGKFAYRLPLFTNVWLNSAGEDADKAFPNTASGGGLPGEYPSGGATSSVLDIWKKNAANLDFIAPDVYLNDYSVVCAKFRHNGQPLFIPEQRRDEYGARRIWVAYGSHAALGVSPFGFDTLSRNENPFTRHYALLKSVSSIVLDAQRKADSSFGFFFDEISDDGTDPSPEIKKQFGHYELTIRRSFVFGKPGPGAGMVIHQGSGVFLLIGWGFKVSVRALDPKATYSGILRFEEKIVENQASGKLRTGRILNGDESQSGVAALMPNDDPDYGDFPIAITIPARTKIAELEVYYICE